MKTNKQLTAIAMMSVVLVGTLSTAKVTNAQESRTPKTNDPENTKVAPNAIGGVDAPSARVAALIRANLDGSVSVFRSKGIAGATRPQVGLVCIQPSPALDVTKIVPTLSIDFSRSFIGNNLVEYRSAGVGCPSGNIAVRTFVLDPNVDKRPDDGVAFTIVVP